ncbi:hypothetical protein [Aeromonas sp. sia0103]|uniref:hypothetical protein n=1 Tax=Aeromonas sp. sia0103 TaxID=2854782 RepID=UPI0030D89442
MSAAQPWSTASPQREPHQAGVALRDRLCGELGAGTAGLGERLLAAVDLLAISSMLIGLGLAWMVSVHAAA